MIRQAVASFFRRPTPPREQRLWANGGPFFFDNGLGPIKWMEGEEGGHVHQQAFQLAAFHACVRVVAESVASLPLHLIERVGRDRRQATDHHLYRLVHDRPNSMQTAYEMLEQHATHVAVHGNAYLLKVFGRGGEVVELWPLHPSAVFPSQLVNNDVVYDVTFGDDPINARRLTADRIIHTRYLSDNGYMGIVPVKLAAGVIEQARAMDMYAQRFWINDARPGVILETSQPVPPEALNRLRQQWEAVHRGVMNAGRTAVLPTGVTAKQLPSVTNEAADWASIRTFCVEEVARQMRVPGSLVGLRTTYANTEQEALNWLQCVVPWCRRIESSFTRGLLDGDSRYSFQLDPRGMLRGDSAARASFYQSALTNGWMTINEVRRLEDLPSIDDAAADEPFVAANNMQPLSKVGRDPVVEASPAVDVPQSDDVNLPQTEAGMSMSDTALNGAQVTALLQVLANVSAGVLTEDAAVSLIVSAFPAIDVAEAKSIVAGVIEAPALEPARAPAPDDPEPVEEVARSLPPRDGRGRFQRNEVER